jgi:hypothetical protein
MNRMTHTMSPFTTLPRHRIRARLVVVPRPRTEPPLWIGAALIATGFVCLAILFVTG